MATNKVFASYQEIIDLHTEPDKVSCIGIHTPKGNTPHKMFSGFFDQFKKYKYRGCSVTLVPAARLPVDPLQVSYDNPNDGIDARDLMNPLMFHGCHGQDLGAILNNLYSVGLVGSNYLVGDFSTPSVDLMQFVNKDGEEYDISVSLLEKLYYKALTDNTWKKAHPQKGFKKSGLRPLIYRVNATHQIMPDEDVSTAFDDLDDLGTPGLGFEVSGADIVLNRTPTKGGLQFVANKLTSLGWLDTRNVITNQSTHVSQQIEYPGPTDLDESLVDLLNGVSKRATLPTVFMGVILLPPAYQVVQHFRMIINHYFAFAGFRGISFQNDNLGEVAPTYFNMDSDDNPDPDPDPPGPDPPGPDPPTPSTYSVTVNYTMTEDSSPVSSEFQTSFSVGSKSGLLTGSTGSVTLTGFEDGTYNIVVADILDHETTFSPSTVVVNGANATVNLSVEYTSDAPVTPVITLSDAGNVSGLYHSYKIDDGSSINLNYDSIKVQYSTSNQNSTIVGLLLSSDKLFGRSAIGLRFNFETMTTPDSGQGDPFTVTNPGGNSDLISILHSGDYEVVLP